MTYEELIAAAKSYADRNDIEVADNVDIFIKMAEARMNRVLKTRKQSARVYTPTVTGQEYYSFPPDYAGMRDLQLNCGSPGSDVKSIPFSYINPELLNSKRGQNSSELYYTVISNQLQIFPVQAAGSTLEICYYQKVQPLTSEEGETTNWMSLDNPDIYLSGIVAEIELFAKNYEVAQLWDTRMTRAIEELESTNEKEVWSGSQLITRLG